MKILLIAPGASFHTIRWAERLMASGFEVVLYAQDNVVPKIGCKVWKKEWVQSENRRISPVRSLVKEYFQLRKILKAEDPDLVHLHWLLSPTALALSFIRGRTIVGTPWGSDILPTNEKDHWGVKQKIIYFFSLKKLVSRIDYFTCDADHLKARLVSLGAKKQTIQIIYFGTDGKNFGPEKRSSILRSTWGICEKDIAILSTRHFFPVYDIPTLIRAFCVIKKEFENTTLVLGGSGSELEALKSLIRMKGIENSVYFLGHLEDDDYERSIASADIYVSTSTSDGGLASSVAEAMSSQLPVVITQFGENEKWLDSGKNGLSFPIGDSDALAICIKTLILDSTLRNRMGINGRSTILKNLNPEVESIKLKNFYFQIKSIK